MKPDEITREIQIVEREIAGLEELVAIHNKIAAANDQIRDAEFRANEFGVDIQAAKEELGELQAQKADAVRETTKAFAGRMSQVLHEGTGVFRIEDGGVVTIGWERDGVVVPHQALSGGAKAQFSAALAYALGATCTVIEAGECDSKRLQDLVDHMSGSTPDGQVIINAWHLPKRVPDTWNVIELEPKSK